LSYLYFIWKTIYAILKRRFCKTWNIVLRARDIVQSIDTNLNTSAPEAETEINITSLNRKDQNIENEKTKNTKENKIF